MYDALISACARADNQPDTTFAALYDLAQSQIGCKLFTAIRWDVKEGVCQRKFTNMPDHFGAEDPIAIKWGDWADLVLKQHEIYLANTPDDMRWAFSNVDDIVASGVSSVLNLPIIAGGEIIGTVNLLHDENYFTPERVEAAKDLLLLPGLAAFLLERELRGQAQ